MTKIYLDNAATTPVDKRVIDAMLPYFDEFYGNPSSLHSYGSEAKNALEDSRAKLAGYLNAKPSEIYFTSSGTESNNLALKGVAFANRHKGNHIIVSSIEHDCILNTCNWLESQGFAITYLPVDNYGLVDIEALQNSINSNTVLVSVMHANNEAGTIQPIEAIGKICKENNIYFHTDACQSFGKEDIDVVKQNVDLLTLSSHKIYGPKGVAALFIKNNVNISPILHGGGQENNMRPSTENISGIVGFVKAAELCFSDFGSETTRIKNLRDKLTDNLKNNIEELYINGHPTQRLANNLNFSIHGFEGETIRLLLLLDKHGIAVSTGSACSANSDNSASHVLQAIGLNQFEARGAVRVSLGRFNTDNDIDIFTETLLKCIKQLNPIMNT